MEEKLKIKPLTKQQIIISIDRLTRFKPAEEKYLRVFKEIITSNLISPKFSKKMLEALEYEKLTSLAQSIINFSLKSLNINLSGDFSTNEKLLDYEKSVFTLDENTKILLENEIDYKSSIEIFDNNKIPKNLIWLKFLSENKNQIEQRINFSTKFPIEKIFLAEGITEEILMPKFASVYGFNFDQEGINLISAGGKNQVVKSYYNYSETLKLPMFVLLDSDARDNYEQIKPKLRAKDKVHILKGGEFEDILPLNLIKRTINRNFKNYFSITLDELRDDKPMTKILDELFKAHGLEFKKAEFAHLVSQNIESKKDISPEIETIIAELKSM